MVGKLARNTRQRQYYLVESEDCYTTRDGGAVQAGRRQSIPSQSMASCAEVSRTGPSAKDGQGKRPCSRTLYLTCECSLEQHRSAVSAGHASVSSSIRAAVAMCRQAIQSAWRTSFAAG